MDDRSLRAQINLALVGVIALTTALIVGASVQAESSDELQYISPARTAELERTFTNARASASDLDALTKGRWRCDLYGVRTRLQVRHDVSLYAFSARGETVVNEGELPTTEYVFTNGALHGRGVRGTLDQVRLTPDGRLVSKLSLESVEGGPSRALAYSVCTTSPTP